MATRRWIRDPLTLSVAALASYRMARLVTTDDLPPVRNAVRWLDRRTPAEYAILWSCTWCVSFWTSVAIVGAGELAHRHKRRNLFLVALLPWAFSTVSGVLADREIH